VEGLILRAQQIRKLECDEVTGVIDRVTEPAPSAVLTANLYYLWAYCYTYGFTLGCLKYLHTLHMDGSDQILVVMWHFHFLPCLVRMLHSHILQCVHLWAGEGTGLVSQQIVPSVHT
jgi:hypothetical protein